MNTATTLPADVEVAPVPGPYPTLALGGLVFGIGLLDAEEVLRYMDAAFRQHTPEEEARTK